jgi:hypothetical protein
MNNNNVNMTNMQIVICKTINALVDQDVSLERAIEMTKESCGVSYDEIIAALYVDAFALYDAKFHLEENKD